MRKVDLKSGKVLEVSPAPFSDSFALFQSVCDEMKSVNISKDYESPINMFKDMLCNFMASKKFEECLWKCMVRSRIDGSKIVKDIFEDPEVRGDFITVCMEVSVENLLPFTKDLYALCDQALALMGTGSPK